MLKTIHLFFALFLLGSAAEIDLRYFDDNRSDYIKDMQNYIRTESDPSLREISSKLLDEIGVIEKQSIKIPPEVLSLDANPTLSRLKEMLDLFSIQQVALEDAVDIKEQILKKKSSVKSQIERLTSQEKNELHSLQLQYTMYHLLTKQKEKFIVSVEEFLHTQKALLAKAVGQEYEMDIKQYQNEFKSSLDSLEKLSQKQATLESKLERATLVGSRDIENLQANLKALEAEMKKSVTMQYNSLANLLLCAIVLGDQEQYALAIKQSMPKSNEKYYDIAIKEIKSLAKIKFGLATSALITYKESFFDSFWYVVDLFFKPLFVYNEKAITSVDVLKLVFIVLFGFMIASVYRKRINAMRDRWLKTSPMTIKLMANIGYYFIVFITMIIALSSIGVDLTSVSMLASALAIGIGFGLQTVVSNMVAGIILMFERSIRVGDYIELSPELHGQVTDMRIRSTTIKTFDNIDVVVPNSSFVQNNVVNLSLDDKTRRIHIPFGVAYGTKVEDVQSAVLSELKKSDLNYLKTIKDKEPCVRMTAMNASSVDYSLLVWVEWDNQIKPASIHSDFLILIYNALYKHKIEIPFPQMDLHVKEMPNR